MGLATQQGSVWGARAQDWAEANEPAWTDVFEAVMDHVGAKHGRSLLDVGCGAGGALTAARARGAKVAGLDASEALVHLARGLRLLGEDRSTDLAAMLAARCRVRLTSPR